MALGFELEEVGEGAPPSVSAKRALTPQRLKGIEPLFRVALAVIAQAVRDTEIGDREAVAWLAGTGADWSEILGGEAVWVWDWLDSLVWTAAA
jgi:hypothetical protein